MVLLQALERDYMERAADDRPLGARPLAGRRSCLTDRQSFMPPPAGRRCCSTDLLLFSQEALVLDAAVAK